MAGININLSYPSIDLIFHTKCAIVAEIYNYWVQPLIKRESIWIDHKTLFPVLEAGFFILDILMKLAI